MRRRLPIAVLTSAILALAAAGCGSSSLSNAAFTSKANAICSQANAANNKLIREESGLAAMKADVPVASKALGKLEALPAPSDRAAAYKTLLSVIKDELSYTRQFVAAYSAGDRTKALSLEGKASSLAQKGTSSAKASGLTGCV